MLCANCQVWLKLAQWFWRRIFLNIFNRNLLFRYYLPLEKEPEETWIPSTQGCFVPSLVEIGPVVLEKKIFKFRQFIFTISWLSPLRKGRGFSFKQNLIPFSQGCICSVWLKFAQWFWRWKWKSEKFTTTPTMTTTTTTDNGHILIRKPHLRIPLR